MPDLIRSIRSLCQAYAANIIALGAFAAIGLAIALFQIGLSPAASDRAENWTLPKLKPAVPSALSDDDVAARFWTEQPREPKKKDDAAKKAPVAPWRFLGTTDRGADRVAIISVEGGKARRIKAGDALPDGSIVTQVLDGELLIDVQGQSSSLRIFAEKKLP
jgi:hypothetical protein